MVSAVHFKIISYILLYDVVCDWGSYPYCLVCMFVNVFVSVIVYFCMYYVCFKSFDDYFYNEVLLYPPLSLSLSLSSSLSFHPSLTCRSMSSDITISGSVG